MGVLSTCPRLLPGSRPRLQSLVTYVACIRAPPAQMSHQDYGRRKDFSYRRGRGRRPGRGGGGRGSRGGFGGPPRGLSGREIGMYYRTKSLEHKKEREKNEVSLLGSYAVKKSVQQRIGVFKVFLTPSSACCGLYRPSCRSEHQSLAGGSPDRTTRDGWHGYHGRCFLSSCSSGERS